MELLKTCCLLVLFSKLCCIVTASVSGSQFYAFLVTFASWLGQCQVVMFLCIFQIRCVVAASVSGGHVFTHFSDTLCRGCVSFRWSCFYAFFRYAASWLRQFQVVMFLRIFQIRCVVAASVSGGHVFTHFSDTLRRGCVSFRWLCFYAFFRYAVSWLRQFQVVMFLRIFQIRCVVAASVSGGYVFTHFSDTLRRGCVSFRWSCFYAFFRYAASWLRQFQVVMWRCWVTNARNSAVTLTRFLQMIVRFNYFSLAFVPFPSGFMFMFY